MGMMTVSEFLRDPVVRGLIERHALTDEVVRNAAAEHEPPLRLLRDLLELIDGEFRHVDAWGKKAQFKQAVAERIRACSDARTEADA